MAGFSTTVVVIVVRNLSKQTESDGIKIMSVQFGRWNFEGQPPVPDTFEKIRAFLNPYGPDSNDSYVQGSVLILYHAFHTTKESHRETQPHISPSGAVITWDGRLDNRAELISELDGSVTISSTDVAIVAAAYQKSGTNCFGKLIGDWALSIWDPNSRSLLLAKDPVATRHLYYSFDKDQVTWSTILDPLVLFAGRTFAICEEYIAGWFTSMFPAVHLTPYVGIHAVPPSSFVLLRPGKHEVSKYWDFDTSKRVRYRTDGEYEEHFRSVFSKAVQRRLRSDRPVLAELSGGMDSSSIVCVADIVVSRGIAETPRLDTISWYDDSYDDIEPEMNEHPYFSKVEEKRRRTGYHINLRELRAKGIVSQRTIMSNFETHRFAVLPPLDAGPPEFFKQYSAHMMSQGHRVVLSGIGGGEVTGGDVPTPRPELQDLLARARFFTLARQLKAWAVKMRTSRVTLLKEVAQGFFPLALGGVSKKRHSIPWLEPEFARRNSAALCACLSRVKLFGALPSFQENLHLLDADRRLMAYFRLCLEPFRDIRYPYFDRDLLEFMYAIPREQVVRVGQRRSLMKRALIGIVPTELLNRRQKTFVSQDAKKDFLAEWPSLAEMCQQMVSGSLRLIDPNRFLEALLKVQRNEEVPIESLKRTLMLELWLRHLTIQGVLKHAMSTKRREYCLPLETKELQRVAQPKSSAS
jgi:asparagine synthase (glutamine-hydrolysing)